MSYPRPVLSQCPFCDGPAECDEVDVGVGYVQCGPYLCSVCGASQIGPEAVFTAGGYAVPGVELDADEAKYGWYKRRVSPHANTFEGQLVSHEVALALYRVGKLDKKPPAP